MMKAIILNEQKKLCYSEIADPLPKDAYEIVNLQAAALNHRDNWITKGMYPGVTPNIALGSDGVGTLKGESVIINPSIHWGESQNYQSKKFEILGMPSHGTFAEKVIIPSENVHKKPEHLSLEQAAALPLAGLTAFRALFSRTALQPNENILITGIGGGVSSIALQFAVAAKANVFVNSSSNEKIANAISAGAKDGANYINEDWHEVLKKKSGGFDVIIDGAGGKDFSKLCKICKPGARIALYGGTSGVWSEVKPQDIFYKQLNILGSTMGSPNDFSNMLSFVSEYSISPIVDSCFELKDAKKAIEKMNEGLQSGKIVLKIS